MDQSNTNENPPIGQDQTAPAYYPDQSNPPIPSVQYNEPQSPYTPPVQQPIQTDPLNAFSEAPPPPLSSPSPLAKILPLAVFLVLFGIGIFASISLRPSFSTLFSKKQKEETPDETQIETPVVLEEDEREQVDMEEPVTVNSPQPEVTTRPTSIPKPTSSGPFVAHVQDKRTGTDYDGVSFQLPSGVKPLECDKPNCISQGTFLPGGTRFTVALRGVGQPLRDFRGAVISDSGGNEFRASTVTFKDRESVAYEADFTGSTVNNIRFGKMRGIMIALSDDLSIELNHFNPVGVNADFASDDLIFETIVQSLLFENSPPSSGETKSVLPSPTDLGKLDKGDEDNSSDQ